MINKSIFILLGSILLGGCSTTSPIQKANESKSAFFFGKPNIVSRNIPEEEQYRIYHRAATGFVSIQWLRSDVEQRATDFCERKGKAMEVVSEQQSHQPYILGNFPRIEIIFGCVDKPNVKAPPTFEDTKYIKLSNLKKLLDSGVITKEEYEKEKSKILNQ